MKLIIAGASGYVATEVLRQALSTPSITSIIALGRRPISPPANLAPSADVSKLHSVTLDDYGTYPDDVKKHFVGADACIWTVAITPNKSRGLDFAEVRRVCQDCTLAGLHAIFEAAAAGSSSSSVGGESGRSGRRTTPFRFLYMSGAATERDQTKTPSYMPSYSLMRGETENRVLAFAAEHKDELEACVAKPGIITAQGQYLKTLVATALKFVMALPHVDVKEISAAMLQQVVNGFDKELLENEDLVRNGCRALGGAA